MPFGYRHTTKSVLTPDELAKADREVLVTAHAALMQQQAQAAHENEGLLNRVQRLQNQLIERNELELKIASLQKAHKAQTAYKTALTTKLQIAGHLKQTVHRQERAITQLETIVAEKANCQHVEDGAIPSPALTLLQQENAQIEARLLGAQEMADQIAQLAHEGLRGESLATKLTELEAENATLERANAELERAKGRDSSGVGGGVNVDSLEATSKALQGQMLATAKVQAAELTALWLQLTESKSAAAAGFSSQSAFVLNEAAPARAVPAQLKRASLSSYGRQPDTRPSRLEPL